MFANYLKFTFRNLYKHKTYTLIKISGLALALAVCMIIFIWMQQELSYDKFHQDADSTFRILMEQSNVALPPGFKPMLDNIPEIEHTVRMYNTGFVGEKTKVVYGEKIFTNDNIYYADSDFFNIFDFPLLYGHANGILSKPNAAVITQSTAHKYFGDNNPVGQTLLLSDQKEIEITGVIKDIPANSHFHFDILIAMHAHSWLAERNSLGSAWMLATYVKLNNPDLAATVTAKINQALAQHPEQPEYTITLQPMTDIHLHSNYRGELEANGDIKYIYLFSAIGLLIITIAGINYINLTTALATRRAREIGIRKAIGADQRQLVFQVMGESIMVTIVSFVLALLAINFMRPIFMSLTGSTLFSTMPGNPWMYLAALLFTIVLGALTGLFPALALSAKKIIDAIKPGFAASQGKKKARGLLVGFQFCISIILLVCTLVIFQQMQYIQHKKLGYNKDHVLVLHTGYDAISQKSDILKSMLAASPDISSSTFASQLPTDIMTAEGVNTKDGTRYNVYYISVDKDFFDVMDIQVIKGEEQIANIPSQKGRDWQHWENRFVINQTLLNDMGINAKEIATNPLIIRHGNMNPGAIVGVVQDFHFKSLHTPIKGLVFEFTPESKEYLLVRLNSNNIPKTIGYIREMWDRVAEGIPFEYRFLDDSYNSLYQMETKTGQLFLAFTFISLFIIILGLLGLVSFMTNRKAKEVGIRKVLGAPIQSIILLLSKSIIIWAIIANLVAWPIAGYAMHQWLQNFSYRIQLSLWMFALAGILALGIALLSISWLVVRAATADPVKTIRYE